MLPVEARIVVERKARSHWSIASQRSSSGERFHRAQRTHTTHSRPFFEANASRLPIGNDSMESFAPSGPLQKRQEANTRKLSTRCEGPRYQVRDGCDESHNAHARARSMRAIQYIDPRTV